MARQLTTAERVARLELEVKQLKAICASVQQVLDLFTRSESIVFTGRFPFKAPETPEVKR